MSNKAFHDLVVGIKAASFFRAMLQLTLGQTLHKEKKDTFPRIENRESLGVTEVCKSTILQFELF